MNELDDGKNSNGGGASDRSLNPQALFTASLDLIRRTVRFVARRHALGHQDLEDFEAEVHLKLIVDDYAVLRRYQGRSSLPTYLVTVIQRALLDFQIKRWGKWRPSAPARRFGPLAVELERLMGLEGRSFDEACAILAAATGRPLDRDRLLHIAANLPVRPQRRSAGPEPLETVIAPGGNPDDGLEASERSEIAGRAEKILAEALARLSADERLLVGLAFFRELPVSVIARTLGRDQRRLYRGLERSLGRMRAYMESRGLSAEILRGVLGDPASRIEVTVSGPTEVETPHDGPTHHAGAGTGDSDPK